MGLASRVVHNLQDADGLEFSKSTSAEQVGSWLYVGSLDEPKWGLLSLTLPLTPSVSCPFPVRAASVDLVIKGGEGEKQEVVRKKRENMRKK